MWTDQHRTRLKDVVMQAGLDEVARFLERAGPATRLNAKSDRAATTAPRGSSAASACSLASAGRPHALTMLAPLRPWRSQTLRVSTTSGQPATSPA